MKKTLLSLFAISLSSAAMAQQPEVGKFSIIPRIGVSIANLNDDILVYDNLDCTLSSRYRTGFMGGADIEYQALPNLSVSLGAYYMQQGCNYKNSFVSNSATKGTGTGYSDLSTQLHYLQVPLMANIYIAPGVAIKAGLQMGFAMSSKMELTTTDYTENKEGEITPSTPKEESYNLNSTMKKVNFSIPVGFSYEFANVVLDARYNIGLTPIQQVLDYKGPKNKVFTVSVGYRFTL